MFGISPFINHLHQANTYSKSVKTSNSLPEESFEADAWERGGPAHFVWAPAFLWDKSGHVKVATIEMPLGQSGRLLNNGYRQNI